MEATIIGLFVGLCAVIGGVICRDRFIVTSISNGDKVTHDAMLTNVNTLHERINNVKDQFVRRDDLDKHLQRIDDNLKSVLNEQRDMNRAILELTKGLANDRTNRT